jgi:diaminopimelate decarboxylase
MPQPLPASLPELHALVAAFGTPLQLYSADGIRAQASMLQRAFLVHFPAFKEYYAVKALPNPSILRLVLDSGCGLDCSSSGELWVAEQLGVKGEDIMFTSNYTSDADLAQAARLGAIINLDDVSLVGQLAQVCRAAKLPFPELICFRLNPGMGNTQSETVSNLLGGPTAKFGVPPDDIVECYRLARAAGAKRFGLHMMTGSCVLEEAYWSATVAKLMEVAVAVKKQVGIEFEFVNIGGGLGIPYRADQQVVDLDGVAARVRAEFVKAYGPDRSKWCVPGRGPALARD